MDVHTTLKNHVKYASDLLLREEGRGDVLSLVNSKIYYVLKFYCVFHCFSSYVDVSRVFQGFKMIQDERMVGLR